MILFNLQARLGSLEAIALNDLTLKADKYSPYFTEPLSVLDVSGNTIAYIGSSGTIFNGVVTTNSSLSAPISVQAKKYVDDSITTLINGAPSTLDNLKQIAIALGNGPTLATHLLTSIAATNNLINLNITSNSTILNTNSVLSVGQSNPATGINNQFVSVDPNNFSVFNNQLVVNSTTGVQTTDTLYDRATIDNFSALIFDTPTWE